MIDYNEIIETLRSGIWNDLGRLFVDLENGDKRPNRLDESNQTSKELRDPFISHKFISPYIPQKGYEQNEGDTLTHTSLPTMTLSLTVYSRNKGDALNLAHQLEQWFNFHGYVYLKENDLIVASVESMQDRTTFLETEYDHRVGFDVILRTTDIQTREITTIDRIELNDRTIEGE